MLDLKALLSKILGCCYTKGTSGGWTYKKYLDGTLECWYNGNPNTYTVGTARGSMYAGGWITYTFPVAFVTSSSPTVTASVTLTTDAYVVLAQVSSVLNTSCRVRITGSASITANTNYLIKIHAIGAWK